MLSISAFYNSMKLCLKVGEDGLFPKLPFNEITMADQDKSENLFQILDKSAEKPYFLHFPFYVCLAIIKKNNYLETKDTKQERQFIICLKYIKTHYKYLLKVCVLKNGFIFLILRSLREIL